MPRIYARGVFCFCFVFYIFLADAFPRLAGALLRTSDLQKFFFFFFFPPPIARHRRHSCTPGALDGGVRSELPAVDQHQREVVVLEPLHVHQRARGTLRLVRPQVPRAGKAPEASAAGEHRNPLLQSRQSVFFFYPAPPPARCYLLSSSLGV